MNIERMKELYQDKSIKEINDFIYITKIKIEELIEDGNCTQDLQDEYDYIEVLEEIKANK